MQQELNKEAVASLLSHYKPQRKYILNALHALQDAHPLQYISAEILDAATQHFRLTKAEMFGIVTYYSMFSLKPRGNYHIRLCQSPVCRMMGAEDLLLTLKDKLKSLNNEGLFSLETVECLGRCGKAPAMMVNKEVYTALNKEKLDEIINMYKNK